MNAFKKIFIFYCFLRELFLDGLRYLLSVRGRNHQLRCLEADIIRESHVIEKGLSMLDFRPRFGQERVRKLLALLARGNSLGLEKQPSGLRVMRVARSVLLEYEAAHEKLEVDVGDIVGDGSLFRTGGGELGGAVPVRKIPLEYWDSFRRIAKTRRSVRSFSCNQPIRHEVVRQLAELANSAPSVCNRQTARLHYYSGDQVQRILDLQSGNRGFGHVVGNLLVVTSDLRLFSGINERYQAWIDGGMFAMQLLNSIHARGLGAVALNWSVSNEVDRSLRKVSGICDYERVIVLIAFGEIAEGALAPVSSRRGVDELVVFH